MYKTIETKFDELYKAIYKCIIVSAGDTYVTLRLEPKNKYTT